MEPPIFSHRPSAPTFGRRNPANKVAAAAPYPGDADELTTNVPLPFQYDHVPVLSKRGGGMQWNRQTDPEPDRTERTVPLFNGNLVIDCPVPHRLLKQVPHSKAPLRDEFSHVRYSAVTCDPADFSYERFTLRPPLFARPRDTEILVVITMYNEDDILFARTLRGVLANIKYMTSRKEHPWGKSSWKSVVVCIVGDGRAKINLRTRALLTLLGVYQDGIAKNSVDGKDVKAHLYEYTTQMNVEIKRDLVRVVPTGSVPCQLLFCLKERNQKKINSHRWALQAFGSILNPRICVFVDAGTEPGPASIFNIWKAFEQYPTCGGVTGVTAPLLNREFNVFTNPLIAAQNFEYKIWNVLDRPFDSLLGLRFDMPGAMTSYRYVALLNDRYGEGPLAQYFRPEMFLSDTGAYTANMALTEERALSFALVTKRECCWHLRYEYAASAVVDVPDKASEHILQWRRWFNGNFFGSIYAIMNIDFIFRSSHDPLTKFLLFFQCIYHALDLLFSLFSIGNLFLVFHIVTTTFMQHSYPNKSGEFIAKCLDFFYLGTLFLSFMFAMGHGPRDGGFLSILVSCWSIVMLNLIFALVGLGVKTIRTGLSIPEDSTTINGSRYTIFNIFVPTFVTYTFWLILAVISGSPAYIFNSIIQYILLLPMRINVSNLYAFCNIHDISWGVKGSDIVRTLPSVTVKNFGATIHVPLDDNAEQIEVDYERASQSLKTAYKEEISYRTGNSEEMYFRRARTLVMAPWALANGALVFIVLNSIGFSTVEHRVPQEPQSGIRFVGYVLWSFTILTAIKFFGAMFYFTNQNKFNSAEPLMNRKKKFD